MDPSILPGGTGYFKTFPNKKYNKYQIRNFYDNMYSKVKIEKGNFFPLIFTQVRVLATLDHPYIIGYYDSFEKDGVLMIGNPFYNWSL